MRELVTAYLLLTIAAPVVAGLDDLTGATATDPDFGPWYGQSALPSNTLPATVNETALQRWPFLEKWKMLGPVPASNWITSALPLPAPLNDTNSWRRIAPEPATGVLHLSEPYYEDNRRKARHGRPRPPPPNSVFWVTTTISAPSVCTRYAAVGVDGRCTLWVNGTQTISGPRQIDPEINENIVLFKLALVKGANRLVARCRANGTRSTFWLRLCTAGAPQPNRTPSAAAAAPSPCPTGYRRDGTARYPNATPVTAWDLERNINVLWRTPLFWSKAQPVIVSNKVFVTEEPQLLTCLDKMTGKILWRREANVLEFSNPAGIPRAETLKRAAFAAERAMLAEAPTPWERYRKFLGTNQPSKSLGQKFRAVEWQHQAAHRAWVENIRTNGPCVMPLVYPGSPRAGPWTGYSFGTPVSDGRHIWVKYFTGVTACYDLDGNKKWSVYHPRVQSSGSECFSPILVDGLIILKILHKQNHKIWMLIDKVWLLALDAESGEEVWRTDALDWRPNSTPAVMRLRKGDERLTVIVTGSGTVVRADDGTVLVPRLLGNDGYASPTVEGDILYRFGNGPATATRLIMQDRDHIGARRLWTRNTIEHAGGLVLNKGTLFGLRGDQRFLGLSVIDAATGTTIERFANRGIKNVGVTKWLTVWIPTTLAGTHVFLCDRGTCSGKYYREWADVSVLQARPQGRFIAHNRVDKNLDAPPTFEADRVYIRTDRALTCFARIGVEGKRYEALENARWLLEDIPQVPAAGAEAKRFWRESIENNRSILERAIALAPGSPVAEKSRSLLDAFD